MEISKISPEALTLARAYRPSGSLLPETVDELPNEPNPARIIHPLTPGRSTGRARRLLLLLSILLSLFFLLPSHKLM